MQSQQLKESVSQFVQSQLGNIRVLIHHGTNSFFKETDHTNVKDSSEQLNLLSNFESFLVELQSLLIWEKPYNSACALTLFTSLYWFVVLWCPRFFSIVAAMFFCYHFYEMWTRYVWPEIRAPSVETKENWTSVNPNVLSAPEIENYLLRIRNTCIELFYQVVQFRHDCHGTFCSIVIVLFLIMYFIGRNIPGVVIVYCIAMALFLAPGFLLMVVPSHVFESVIEFYYNLTSSPNAQSNLTKTAATITTVEPTLTNNEIDNNPTDSSTDDINSSSHFSNKFCDNFFSNEPNSPFSNKENISTDSDDFEIISESEFEYSSEI